MRLPAVMKRDTQAALDKARAELSAAERRLAELEADRTAALAADADDDADTDTDNIEVVRAIDRQADDQRGRLAILCDRIAVLESRLAGEQAAQREADYKAAVAKIETALPRRQKAAEQVERALANLAGAVKEFVVATEGVLKVWPDGVEWPERVFPAHALSLERVGRLIQETFSISRGHADRRPPTPAEYLGRACNADRHRGFAQREKELHEEFLADLKTAHDPPPVQSEETTDVENAA